MPDLRYSATLASADAWKAIVLDGTLSKNGMISFARHLKAEDVETLRADLALWCRRGLVAAERPSAYRFGNSLPTGENGKAADWSA